ncbi:MAG: PD-(D/E)XK nuclease family protein [Phycicoccus sp.]|nr:PD-(D/E)XK nuclease family protein [Phycicoccus sp.]
MSNERTFDPGIAKSVAHLPEPPEYWSYSSLKEVESCARRYVLGRATYPNLWAGRGYPQQPNPAALFGDVVHDSLERIIRALVRVGCTSSNSTEAVGVLRELGGYSSVAGQALDSRLASLGGNPRLDTERRARIRQVLEDRIPEMRTAIQGYLQRMTLVPQASGWSSSGDGPPACRPLGAGSHPEVALRADHLRVKGRVDLIAVTAGRADIVDHKTGAQDPSHLDQLLFYALLWDQDDVANEARTPLGTLTAAYPTSEVRIEAPNADEIAAIATQTAHRVTQADERVTAAEPVATIGEQCAYCAVRSLCDAYWRDVAPDRPGPSNGLWFDYEGIVGERNGVKSWWMLDEHGGKELLLRTPPGRPLASGQRVRIIGLRRDDHPDVEAPVATLTTNSELFVAVGDGT